MRGLAYVECIFKDAKKLRKPHQALGITVMVKVNMRNQERLISFDSHQVRRGVHKSDVMRNIEQGQAGSSDIQAR